MELVKKIPGLLAVCRFCVHKYYENSFDVSQVLIVQVASTAIVFTFYSLTRCPQSTHYSQKLRAPDCLQSYKNQLVPIKGYPIKK